MFHIINEQVPTIHHRINLCIKDKLIQHVSILITLFKVPFQAVLTIHIY
jgi:hypothetical protein